MAAIASRSPLSRLQSPVWAIAASLLFVGLLLLVLVQFDAHTKLVELLEWIDRQGVMAVVWFVLLMAAIVVFLLPGIFLTTGAGIVFGVVQGTIYVVLGTLLGASVSFLIARYLFGRRAASFVMQRSGRLKVISDEAAQHDLKVVLLTRLIPFFPSKIANYFFGLTAFSLRGFVLGSLVGFIPFSLHNVYLGSLTADLASLSQGELARSPVQLFVYGLGFVATIVALLYFNRLARRALDSYVKDGASTTARGEARVAGKSS